MESVKLTLDNQVESKEEESYLPKVHQSEQSVPTPELLMPKSANSMMSTEEQSVQDIVANSITLTQSNAKCTREGELECNTCEKDKWLFAQEEEITRQWEENKINVHIVEINELPKQGNESASNHEECVEEKENILTKETPTLNLNASALTLCKHNQTEIEHQHEQEKIRQHEDRCDQHACANKETLCADCQIRAHVTCNSEELSQSTKHRTKITPSINKVQGAMHDHHNLNKKLNFDDDAYNREEIRLHKQCVSVFGYDKHNSTGKKQRSCTVPYLLERTEPVCISQTTSASEWVQLNVGGTVFTTTLYTLEVEPQSVLASIATRLRQARLAQQELQTYQRHQHAERQKYNAFHDKRSNCKHFTDHSDSNNWCGSLSESSSSSLPSCEYLSLSESSSSSSSSLSLQEMQHTQTPANEQSILNSFTCPKYSKFTDNHRATLHECHTYPITGNNNKAIHAFSENTLQVHNEGEVQDLHHCHCIRGNDDLSNNLVHKRGTPTVSFDKNNNNNIKESFSSCSSGQALPHFLNDNNNAKQQTQKVKEHKKYTSCSINPRNMSNTSNVYYSNTIKNKYSRKSKSKYKKDNAIFCVDHDAHNSILLDLDAQYFGPVLNYLRHGTIIIPAEVSTEGVRAVAAYLNVFSLAEALSPPLPAPMTSIPRRRYLFSWGQGSSGELGSQLLEDLPAPTLVQITPFKEHVVQMTLGANYTLARTRTGNVYSFGHGSWGQLGLGNPNELEKITGNRQLLLTVPHRIPFFERHPAMYIASGYAFAMAITCEPAHDYHVYFWGNNNHGQSGLGPTFFSTHNKIYTPHKVEALEGKKIIKVCGGSYFSLALSLDGALYSWGNIECLGLGTPREVEDRFAGTDVLAKSWNNEKRSVILTPQRIHVPVKPTRQRLGNLSGNSSFDNHSSSHANQLNNVPTLSRFNDNISNGMVEVNHTNYHTAVENSNELRTPVLSRMPSSVTSSTSVLLSAQSHEIAEQQEHITHDGNGEHLELSDVHASHEENLEETQTRETLNECEEEQEEIKFVHINTGQWHSAAISTSGQLYTWGVGYQGRLGHGSNASVYTPTRVQGELADHVIIDVSCGSFHTVALTSLGLVFCWGDNDLGQCGVAGPNTHPHSSLHITTITTNNNNSNINYRYNNTYSTMSNNNEWAYASPEGMSGSGSTTEAMMMPYRVVGLELIAGGVARGISCGRRHTAVLMSGPQPFCIADCCCTGANEDYQSSLHFEGEHEEEEEEELLECCCYDGGDGNDYNKQKRRKNHSMYDNNCKNIKSTEKENNLHKYKKHSIVKSSASHGQVYVFGGVEVVNSTTKHFSSSNNNEESVQYSANNIYNASSANTTTTIPTTRAQRRSNSSNNNNYNHLRNQFTHAQLSNRNGFHRGNSNDNHRHSSFGRSYELYHRSQNSHLPRPSPAVFARSREQEQQRYLPTHQRQHPSHWLHHYDHNDDDEDNDNDEDNDEYLARSLPELEQEQMEQVQFSSMPHRTPVRHNTHAEHNTMYTFSGGPERQEQTHSPYYEPHSTLASRPSSQYKRIQGLERFNITHVMCGLYHTFVFAEDTLPYYETPINESISSTMSALTSRHESSTLTNKAKSHSQLCQSTLHKHH